MCFLSVCLCQGEFDSGVKDCDRALELCKDSAKALYRKAVCLKESGNLREAYDCSTACLLVSPQVCVCVCVCVCERERKSVCVCEREREKECVCVCERERKSVCVCVCVCVRERERKSVCA